MKGTSRDGRRFPRRSGTKIAGELPADDVQSSTRVHESGDRETVIADMAAFQTKFPGGHFDIGGVSGHHEHALLTWVLAQGDDTFFATGHDQIRVSQERQDREPDYVHALHFESVVHVGLCLGALAKKSSARSHDQVTGLFEP
jgi:hypothetical protein